MYTSYESGTDHNMKSNTYIYMHASIDNEEHVAYTHMCLYIQYIYIYIDGRSMPYITRDSNKMWRTHHS